MINYLANPHRFMAFSKWAMPALALAALVMIPIGAYWALDWAPAEKYQGDTSRIMFFHVPAAWLALNAYTVMAVASFIYLVWKHNLADLAAKATAPAGAVFTFLALVSGALWGKPTWGAYWVWDARLTSMLVLLFLYFGYIALRLAMNDPRKSANAGAILCLVGVINLPIIKFSVDWWNTLHQPASFLARNSEGNPSLPPEFLNPLLFNAVGLMCLFGACVLAGMRAEIYNRQAEVLISRRLQAAQ